MSVPKSFSVTAGLMLRLFTEQIFLHIKHLICFYRRLQFKPAAIRQADRIDKELTGDTPCMMKPSDANYSAGSGARMLPGRKEHRHQSSSSEFRAKPGKGSMQIALKAPKEREDHKFSRLQLVYRLFNELVYMLQLDSVSKLR